MIDNPVKTLTFTAGKRVRLDDLPPEAWNVIQGAYSGDGDLSDYYHKVSWAFRAIDLLANRVMAMPFAIYRGEQEVDNSDDYQNVVKFLPYPMQLFGLVEMALNVWGKAYAFKRPAASGRRVYDVRYLLPTSVRANIDKETGAITFERDKTTYTPNEIIYFWRPDPFVEYGPPTSGPLTAAAGAANVLLNIDLFAKAYFERGAIKATLLAVDGNPPKEEKERIKSLWQRIMTGMKNAFGEMVINSKSITPIVVGGGLDELSDNELTHEKREAIATALGIPHSKLFSSSAGGLGGGGVAEQDERSLYTDKVIPDVRFIEQVLNAQLFVPAGYRIKFQEERLELFQENEAERADSLIKLQTALENPETFLIARQILGYDLSDEVLALIQAYQGKREERANAVMANMQPRNEPEQEPEREEPEDDSEKSALRAELGRWRRKALKRVKDGRAGKAAEFESDIIPDSLAGAISGALELAQEVADVERIFTSVQEWEGYP